MNKKDLEKKLENSLSNGKMEPSLYRKIISEAFNPNLEVLDGFFVSFNQEIKPFEDNMMSSLINEFNQAQAEADSDDTGKITLISQSDKLLKLLVIRDKTSYVHDYGQGFSQAFKNQVKAYVEVYLQSGIVYVQTRNSTVYSSLRTVIQNLFKFSLEDTKFKLQKPQLKQNIPLYLLTENKAADFSNVDSLTVKILDILYEFENMSYSFSGFQVTDH